MEIREQGQLIKLLRTERCKDRRRRRQVVIGAFRLDNGVPAELLNLLDRNERRELSVWLAAWHDSQKKTCARMIFASAPARLDALATALEAAAELLTPAEADVLWHRLHAVAKGLLRGGQIRPTRVPTPSTSSLGQLDLVDELTVRSSSPPRTAMLQPNDPDHFTVIETWRVCVDTSLFLIEVVADGSWRPAYIAPKRLGGWTIEVLPDMPPTVDVEAAVHKWARQYGTDVTIRRTPIRRPSTQTTSSNRTSE
ncbi:hypothetical protein [Burkholderia sp. BCC0322]|uniref:hypothetical protein n=1 Tax=unclassified Burkholderia TaxID=2613784 RepID=UPI001FC884D6|nr:hypothetical protein [Burkholderia sp. BCC0322]